MSFIEIDFNDILDEIIYFFNYVIRDWEISYTDRNGNNYVVSFVALFIGVILLGKILSVFFGHYDWANFDEMSDDDLYD